MSYHSYLLISTAIHGNSQYIITPEQVLTWDEADAGCGLLGGSLVVFEDNEEFDYMKTLLPTCKFMRGIQFHLWSLNTCRVMNYVNKPTH